MIAPLSSGLDAGRRASDSRGVHDTKQNWKQKHRVKAAIKDRQRVLNGQNQGREAMEIGIRTFTALYGLHSAPKDQFAPQRESFTLALPLIKFAGTASLQTPGSVNGLGLPLTQVMTEVRCTPGWENRTPSTAGAPSHDHRPCHS
jgi:hypothetical protein